MAQLPNLVLVFGTWNRSCFSFRSYVNSILFEIGFGRLPVVYLFHLHTYALVSGSCVHIGQRSLNHENLYVFHW